ncbi:Electron transport complex subunit RsxB [bioreactor metagenome]|jgi:iron only hydrogenase large subunit-like protein|uniref:Ferredoxin n=2 Tax=root TaxID=1 RepID=A0A652ZTH6_9SPIR|nr:Ferredoxin [uncultured Spirochaetota bacterium]
MKMRADMRPEAQTGNFFHSVYLDKELCVGCTTCIKRCPTQAIRVRDGKAHIAEERCIDCGECIRTCPKGAKKWISDPLAVMEGYDIKVALPAPSLYGQFGVDTAPDTVFLALRDIGFDEVFDVAWGAARLGLATKEYLDAAGPRPMISSACPVVVRLVQLRFPSLIPQLVHLLPPFEIAARELRRRLEASIAGGGDKGNRGANRTTDGQPRIGVFFISPCTSKVTAIRNPLGYVRSEVDAVFSFQDIYAPLKKAIQRRKAAGESTCAGSGPPSKMGRIEGLGGGFGWARSDGELEALNVPGAVSVDGIDNLIALLEEIDNGKLGDIPYIEALACPGGCVGGPMVVANPHVARTAIKAVSVSQKGEEAPEARSFNGGFDEGPSAAGIGRSADAGFEALEWEEELPPKPVMVLDRDLEKALAMAERLEELAASLPGLDCGACGAPDCRALAEDIVKGEAELDDCIVRLRRKTSDS